MSAPLRHSVKIQLGGTELTVSSEHSPDYTREVAAHFDAVLARIRSSVPSVDAHRAALLAGLPMSSSRPDRATPSNPAGSRP